MTTAKECRCPSCSRPATLTGFCTACGAGMCAQRDMLEYIDVSPLDDKDIEKELRDRGYGPEEALRLIRARKKTR